MKHLSITKPVFKNNTNSYKIRNPKTYQNYISATVSSEPIEETTTFNNNQCVKADNIQLQNVINKNTYDEPLTLWDTSDVTAGDMEGMISPLIAQPAEQLSEIHIDVPDNLDDIIEPYTTIQEPEKK